MLRLLDFISERKAMPDTMIGDGLRQSFNPEQERLMRERLRMQPRDAGLRLQLLELLFDRQDRERFIAETQAFATVVPDHASTPEWHRCLSLGRTLAPDVAPFRGSGPGRLSGVSATAGAALFGPRYRRFADEECYLPHFNGIAGGFDQAWRDPGFQARLDLELTFLARRPSPLIHARRLSQLVGGAQIYLKREDTSPVDTHLCMAVSGQALLAERMGRKALVTGTIDGRSGVQTASIAARLGLRALVFMQADELERRAAELFRIRQLGAEVRVTEAAAAPREKALQHWASRPGECMLTVGLEGAPQPYPRMNRQFVAAIGRECQRQLRVVAKRPADLVVTRGSATADALGLFPAFLGESHTRLVCVEPPAEALEPVQRGASSGQEHIGQRITYAPEYPGVVREHTWLRGSERVDYARGTPGMVRNAVALLGSSEGLLPDASTAAALGWACEEAAKMKPEQAVVVMLAEDASRNPGRLQSLMQGA